MTFDVPASTAAGWGAMYVVEGSRLGGIMLSRSVPEGMPSAYLESKHLSGEWRALLAAIDGEPADEAWIEEAIVGAKAAFELYRRASGLISRASPQRKSFGASLRIMSWTFPANRPRMPGRSTTAWTLVSNTVTALAIVWPIA